MILGVARSSFVSDDFAAQTFSLLVRSPEDVQSILITSTEIIDASAGGDPDILEDNWRLASQANKPMVILWIGKAIFTFAEGRRSRFRIGSRQDHRQEEPVDY